MILPLLIFYIDFWLYIYSQRKTKAAWHEARWLAGSLCPSSQREAMSGSTGQMVHSKTTIAISSTAAVEEEEEEQEEEFAASKNSSQHVKSHLKIQQQEEEEQQE